MTHSPSSLFQQHHCDAVRPLPASTITSARRVTHALRGESGPDWTGDGSRPMFAVDALVFDIEVRFDQLLDRAGDFEISVAR